VPILLTKKKPPNFKKVKAMSLKEVYKASPFGMVSSFFYGTIQSALFTLLAVYAASMNFSIFEISLVTFLLAISGAISQWPIGKIMKLLPRKRGAEATSMEVWVGGKTLVRSARGLCLLIPKA